MHAYRGYKHCTFVVDYEEFNLDGPFDRKKPTWIPKTRIFKGIRSALSFIKKNLCGFRKLSFTHEPSQMKPGYELSGETDEIINYKQLSLERPFEEIMMLALPVHVYVLEKRGRRINATRYYETREIAEKEIRSQGLKCKGIFDYTGAFDDIM